MSWAGWTQIVLDISNSILCLEDSNIKVTTPLLNDRDFEIFTKNTSSQKLEILTGKKTGILTCIFSSLIVTIVVGDVVGLLNWQFWNVWCCSVRNTFLFVLLNCTLLKIYLNIYFVVHCTVANVKIYFIQLLIMKLSLKSILPI